MLGRNLHFISGNSKSLNLISKLIDQQTRKVGLYRVLFSSIYKQLHLVQNNSSYKVDKYQKAHTIKFFSNMSSDEDVKNATSIFDFTVKDTHGNDVSLEKYRGYVTLIVNIASQCGLTKSNYEKLNELKAKYYDRGLRILSFPCNQFSSQMPEKDGEEMVCHLLKANAEFGDLFQKVNVNGNDAHPLYKYLKLKQKGTLTSTIKWNFTKFLVDKDGQPVNRYAPTTDPMDISRAIEKLL